MDNQGLLFIPDISGFTRFVNESEIEHSRLMVKKSKMEASLQKSLINLVDLLKQIKI